MSEKGALKIDKAAHSLMEFIPREGCGGLIDGFYMVFYHEERLYSVRNTSTGVVSLVYADSPHDAIQKVGENRTIIKTTIDTAISQLHDLCRDAKNHCEQDGSLDDVYQDDINALNTGVKALEAIKMFLEEAEE